MAERIKILIASFDINFFDFFSFRKVFGKNFSLIENFIKNMLDFTFSVLFIILFFPIYIIIAFSVKISSKGSIIYKQERIGKYGKPFIIYKFRTMCANAEKNGPELSLKDDKRITKIGHFLRKTKLDETPQFFNILKGDMSLVGPRPERKYFIDLILIKEPSFKQSFTVKPGITSLGQIEYGYAHNVEQMLKRFKYDSYYLKNKSLYFDTKILLHTALFLIKNIWLKEED